MDIADLDNRFAFHPADTDEKRTGHESIRAACRNLAGFINDTVPDGREKSLAITSLEEAMFWANAGLARPQRAAGGTVQPGAVYRIGE